jgi:phospholipase C
MRQAIALLLCGGVAAACSSSSRPGATTTTQAWNASSPTDETKSTHLWVVNRAIDITSNHVNDIPSLANTLAWIRDDAECRSNWETGLYEADYLAPFNAGTGDLPLENGPSAQGCCCGIDLSTLSKDVNVVLNNSTWLIHFYDPSTSLDYGNFASSTDLPTGVLHPIYSSMQSILEANGNAVPLEARGAAIYRFGNARNLLEGVNVPPSHQDEPSDLRDRGCYELGLAMHYVTDITQPMHASNFTAASLPRLLHSNFEEYAQSIQSTYAVADWTQTPTGGDLMTVIQQIAQTSKAHWVAPDGSPGPLKKAYQDAYAAGSTWDASGNPVSSTLCTAAAVEASGDLGNVSLDVPSCWQNNGPVTDETGSALRDAQISTATFLAAIQLPPYVATGIAPADGTSEDAGSGGGGDWGDDQDAGDNGSAFNDASAQDDADAGGDATPPTM